MNAKSACQDEFKHGTFAGTELHQVPLVYTTTNLYDLLTHQRHTSTQLYTNTLQHQYSLAQV